ncbi:MAG TPA: response regulator [Blastocatellia bacterium]|nr:response regulator [Blastocatellia bacterium]
MLNQPHTILVVDDEPANLRMFTRLLRQQFRVICATSGDEALRILKSEKVSLLIADQHMPGMTGDKLLRESMSINMDIVRMIITGDTGTDTFINAIKKGGAVRVIQKPWDPDSLLQIIVAALEKHEIVLTNKKAIDRLKEANDLLSRVSRGS